MASKAPAQYEFCGLRIFASRDGHRVTGRVEFPYAVSGRDACPIDYLSVGSDGPSAQPDGDQKSKADLRQQRKLELVKHWRELCEKNPQTTKCMLAVQAIADKGGDISVRTLQLWDYRFELAGEEGLRDNYVKPLRRVLQVTAKEASDAVMVCAWWAFRIANVDGIDHKMMHAAVEHLIRPGYKLADLLATIDCYYSWQCDRTRFPFKPFARWAKYDFPVPWLYRACDENDYCRGLDAMRREDVPLQSPATVYTLNMPDAKTRRRDALHRPTRSAIAKLAGADASIAGAVSKCDRAASEGASNTAEEVALLRSSGCREAATATVQRRAVGLPALSANRNPATVAEGLGILEDQYRIMLSRAARGDKQARAEAVATMPLWWESMPASLRNDIDFKIQSWRSDHPNVTEAACATRKLLMLLPHLRGSRSGAQRLFPASRIGI